MESRSFVRFAGFCAIVAGVGGFIYSIAFVVLLVGGVAPVTGQWLTAVTLLVNAIVAVPVFVALYNRGRAIDGSFALVGLLFALSGQLGAALHGGYDLSIFLHPPASVNLDLPSSVDPRGLATFGLVGLGLVIFSWLLARDRTFPSALRLLLILAAVLSLVLYLGRLVLLDPTNPIILVAALAAGFLVNPGWYLWLGLKLLRVNHLEPAT